MDAGLAAVLGALAGAVGAVGGAWTTSRVQWKSARLTARAEHKRQRREPRHEVYATFLTAANQFSDAWLSVAGMGAMTNERRDAITQAASAVKAASPAVALAGPEEISAIAESIRDQAVHLQMLARGLWAGRHIIEGGEGYPEPWIRDAESALPQVLRKFSDEVHRFTRVARATLDDDGSTL